MSDKAIVVEGGGPFLVRVREGASESRHEVSMQPQDAARWGGDGAALIRAAFAFLLDREPKEAILARFDLSLIPRYFPEFERELPRYLDEAR